MGCVQSKKFKPYDGLQEDNSDTCLKTAKESCQKNVAEKVNSNPYLTQTLKEPAPCYSTANAELMLRNVEFPPIDVNIMKLTLSSPQLTSAKDLTSVDYTSGEDDYSTTHCEHYKTEIFTKEHLPPCKPSFRRQDFETFKVDFSDKSFAISDTMLHRGISKESSTKLRDSSNTRINRICLQMQTGRLLNRQTVRQWSSWRDAIRKYFDCSLKHIADKPFYPRESLSLSDMKIYHITSPYKNRERVNLSKLKKKKACISPTKNLRNQTNIEVRRSSSHSQSNIKEHLSSQCKDPRVPHVDFWREEEVISQGDSHTAPVITWKSSHDHLSAPRLSHTHSFTIDSRDLVHLPATPFSSVHGSDPDIMHNDYSMSEIKSISESRIKSNPIVSPIFPLPHSKEPSTKDDNTMILTVSTQVAQISKPPVHEKFPDFAYQDDSRRAELKCWLLKAAKLGIWEDVYALTLLGATGVDEAIVYSIEIGQNDLAVELISGGKRRALFTSECLKISSTLRAPFNQLVTGAWKLVAEMCIEVGHLLPISKRKKGEMFDTIM